LSIQPVVQQNMLSNTLVPKITSNMMTRSMASQKVGITAATDSYCPIDLYQTRVLLSVIVCLHITFMYLFIYTAQEFVEICKGLSRSFQELLSDCHSSSSKGVAICLSRSTTATTRMAEIVDCANSSGCPSVPVELQSIHASITTKSCSAQS
jgi:hypothetical protein